MFSDGEATAGALQPSRSLPPAGFVSGQSCARCPTLRAGKAAGLRPSYLEQCTLCIITGYCDQLSSAGGDVDI